MNNLKKSAWHEPDAEEFRRYLKEGEVMNALQPALTLLYKLPVKPTDLYEFFAEYLEDGARTMVKLSLLKAEHCFIKNQIHVMKKQVKQIKERILDAEALVKTFQEGTNPLLDDSHLKKFSLIDRFISDVNLDQHRPFYTPSQMLLQIENAIDAEDEERRDMEPILKFIEDHEEIDPLGILFDFRIPEPEDQDPDTDEPEPRKRSQPRSKSIFERANTLIDLDSESNDDEDLQASALTHGRLVIGMGRLQAKRKEERKLVKKPIGVGIDGDEFPSKAFSSESPYSSDAEGYDSASSLLNLYHDLRLSSRLKKDKGHRKLLRVLRAKKLKLLSGGNDWLPIAKHCTEKRHNAKHKHKKLGKVSQRKTVQEEMTQGVGDRTKTSGTPEKERLEDFKTGSATKKAQKKVKIKHHDKEYTSIGIDFEIAEKEKYYKLLGNKTVTNKEVEEDEAFLNNLGPNRWSLAEPTTALEGPKEYADARFRTNADFLYEFPLEQVLQAQKWIDNNFMEFVWHLNEPLELKEDTKAFDDDEDDNYVWLDDYMRDQNDGNREINDDNLVIGRRILDRIHSGVKKEKIKRQGNVRITEFDCKAQEHKAGDSQVPLKVLDETDLLKIEPIASVPSLLRVHAQTTSRGQEKRSEKAKRFVRDMFEDQYRKKLMKQFQFDMLDDD